MENTKWFVSIVNRLQPGVPQYNAIKVTDGLTKESDLDATRSYVAACNRAEQLNRQDELRKTVRRQP